MERAEISLGPEELSEISYASVLKNDKQTIARVDRIDQIILPINVVDVEVIVIVPVARPGLGVYEPIAAVAEAAIVSTIYMEAVLGSEASAEVFVAHPVA
jgi:hypothetical protein